MYVQFVGFFCDSTSHKTCHKCAQGFKVHKSKGSICGHIAQGSLLKLGLLLYNLHNKAARPETGPVICIADHGTFLFATVASSPADRHDLGLAGMTAYADDRIGMSYDRPGHHIVDQVKAPDTAICIPCYNLLSTWQ